MCGLCGTCERFEYCSKTDWLTVMVLWWTRKIVSRLHFARHIIFITQNHARVYRHTHAHTQTHTHRAEAEAAAAAYEHTDRRTNKRTNVRINEQTKQHNQQKSPKRHSHRHTQTNPNLTLIRMHARTQTQTWQLESKESSVIPFWSHTLIQIPWWCAILNLWQKFTNRMVAHLLSQMRYKYTYWRVRACECMMYLVV